MVRFGVACMLWAAGVGAYAQPMPRVTLDVGIPPADGLQLNSDYAAGRRLAVAEDGTHYVLIRGHRPGAQPMDPDRDARVELLAIARDGAVRLRHNLSSGEKPALSGFDINALGIVVARSGELAVFASYYDNGNSPGRSSRPAVAVMLRLAADGTVRTQTLIGAPSRAAGRNDPAGHYEAEVFEPTPDNAILVGGGFGSGPYGWWIGKFSLDGVRLWQAGPGNGFPERVASLARRPDGSWIGLVTEMHGRGLDWFVRRLAADGKPLARHQVPIPLDQPAAVLRDGNLFVLNSGDVAKKSELVFTSDVGQVRQRVPWPFPQTLRVVAADDGFAAIVEDSPGLEGPRRIVRADARGVVRWRSTAIDAAEIVRTPDGQIAALVNPGNDAGALRLVRLADP